MFRFTEEQAQHPGLALVAAQTYDAETVPKNKEHWLCWVAEDYDPHTPRMVLSVEPTTQRQLTLEMKQQTVARHQNDKVSVSPNLISKSGKKKRSSGQPAVS